MVVHGTFELTAHPEPPWSDVDGVVLARNRFVKRFTGPLEATSEVHMLAARSPVPGSAGYVALERVTGALAGKAGSFVLQHRGVMDRGARTLQVTVVPDSATGALTGLTGAMDIEIVDGVHHYRFEYELTHGG